VSNPRQVWTPENPRPHGRVRYVQGGYAGDDPCRCQVCRDAQAAYNRQRKAEQTPAYVSATAAREHIAWLASEGVGLKQVAKVSGVSHGALWKLVYGVPSAGRSPSKRIRPETSAAICAVMPNQGADGSRVPAGPVWDHVERLVAAGVPKARIAERIGQRGPGLQLGREYITRKAARAIAEMVAELDAGTLEVVRRSRFGEHPVEVEAPVKGTDEDTRGTDKPLIDLVELLEARIDENHWRRQAACVGKPAWLFFPTRGDMRTIEAAKKVCRGCLVRAQCLEANLDVRDGVFGGLSGRERRDLRRPPVEQVAS
jgi:hypothetical protein